MDEEILFVGPKADQGGPAIKNTIMIQELEKKTDLKIYNTYDRKVHTRLGAIWAIMCGKQHYIIVSVSRKGRNLLYPFLLLRKKMNGARYCCVVIGGNVENSFHFKSAIKAMQKADMVTVETQGIQKSLIDAYDLKNVYWLPNYKLLDKNNIHVNASGRFQESTIRFLFLSSMRNSKGVKTLINAFENVLREGYDVELDFYGPIRDDFDQSILDDIAHKDRIRYCGSVNNSQVLSTMQQYHVFVFPTEYKGEGFPAVLVEAMAAGLPVIASDMNYNPEIIRDGRNGWIFAHGNVEELSNCIQTCVQNRDIMEKISKNNLNDVSQYEASDVLEAFAEKLRMLGWPL